MGMYLRAMTSIVVIVCVDGIEAPDSTATKFDMGGSNTSVDNVIELAFSSTRVIDITGCIGCSGRNAC
jgi:hypothetical protein